MGIKHAKQINLTQIPDPTQADLDAQIALGNYPAGTLLADIWLPSDANSDHTIDGNLDLGSYSLITDKITSKTSSGLILENNSGGDVLHIGNGGGVNATAYGGWNFDGATANKMAYFGASKTLSSVSFITIGSSSLSGGSTTDNFLNLTATMPSTMTAVTNGIVFDLTSAGSSAQQNYATSITYNAGYTGGSPNNAMFVTNNVAGTGASYGASSSVNSYRLGNSNGAIRAVQSSSTTGINYGVQSLAHGSSVANYGAWASASSTLNTPALNVGFMGTAYNATTNTAGAFMLRGSGTPSFTSCAMLADNGDQAVPIAVFRDNGSAVVTIQDGGTVACTGDVTVADEAYGASWNGSLEVPTKNALYDKIETLGGGGITIGQALALNQTLTSYI